MNWTCNGSLYNALVLVVRFEYIYIYMFRSNLIFFSEKMYCRGGSRLNRSYDKYFDFVEATSVTSRPYKLIFRDD